MWRATAGCLLIGSGILALAWIPQAKLGWTVAPQVLAGVGAGLALRALTGELLPQTTTAQAGRLLGVRHAAVALVLIALGPLIASQLNAGVRQAQLQGIALVLDAKLSPQQKLKLAPSLFAAVSTQQPLASLRTALAQHQSEFTGADLAVYRQFGSRIQVILLNVIKRGFRWSFVITGSLAMLAAALLFVLAIGSARGRSRSGVPPPRSGSRRPQRRPVAPPPPRPGHRAPARRGRRPRGLRGRRASPSDDAGPHRRSLQRRLDPDHRRHHRPAPGRRPRGP